MSHGNLADEMQNMYPAEVLTSTEMSIKFQTENGIAEGFAYVTASTTLTAWCEDKGLTFEILADIKSVHSLATLTTWWVNTSATPSAPTFIAVNSIAY